MARDPRRRLGEAIARLDEGLNEPVVFRRGARHPVLEYLPHLEQALVARGFPPMSPWWRETVEAFYAGTQRQLVDRVGRRGGKSSSLSRVAVLEALHGDHSIPPGDVGVVSFVSVRRSEAEQRLRTLEDILRAIGVGYDRSTDGIELIAKPVAFKVFTASIAGVSGFTCICAICDEVSKWRDADTGANPARQVLASLRPTMATQPNARIFLSSSPLGMMDAHAAAYDEGDTPFQMTAYAPSWVANPTLTLEGTRALEPDEATWRREYEAIPLEDTESSVLAAAALDKVTRSGPLELVPMHGWTYVAAMDPAFRGNAWTLVVVTRDLSHKRIVALVREWRGSSSKPLDPEIVLAEMAEILRPFHVKHVMTDQWSGDALAALARREGLHLNQRSLSAADKIDLWDDMAMRIGACEVEIPAHKQLRADLLGVRRRITGNGMGIVYVQTPDGRHCDFAPAAALALDQHCPEPRKLPFGPDEQVEADALARDLETANPKKVPWWRNPKADPLQRR